MSKQSVIHSNLSARNVARLEGFKADQYRSLAKIGIHIGDSEVRQMMSGLNVSAMDAIQPTVTTPSMTTPVQFLQAWLQGFVYVITAARKIDELTGIMTVGNWHDEEVVLGLMELIGTAIPYGDYTNVPLSSWNTNFERATIVHAEEGLFVGTMQSARAGAMRVNDAATKRQAAALALEIFRNNVGFYGFNNGANRTYGFLNNPSLPAYVSVPNGASGSPSWGNKTFEEITRDIRSAIVSLRTQSGDNIDPEKAELTLAVASNSVDWLTVTTSLGYSVAQWLKDTFPRLRVVSAPQLNGANGGANVFYLYADKIEDGLSTDGGNTFIQAVPTKFMPTGIEQRAKGYIEDFTNATAGVMLARPFAVVRRSGI